MSRKLSENVSNMSRKCARTFGVLVLFKTNSGCLNKSSPPNKESPPPFLVLKVAENHTKNKQKIENDKSAAFGGAPKGHALRALIFSVIFSGFQGRGRGGLLIGGRGGLLWRYPEHVSTKGQHQCTVATYLCICIDTVDGIN